MLIKISHYFSLYFRDDLFIIFVYFTIIIKK